MGGSVCFGAFFLAMVKMMRIMFEYVVHQLQHLQGDNKYVKIVIWSIRIVMAAIQNVMDYIKVTAYIMVVMQGCRFYVGAREGCKLLSINSGLVGVTEMITTIILAISRLMMVATSTLVFLLIVVYGNQVLPNMGILPEKVVPRVTSPILPTIVVVCFS